ncbi:alpha/beta fold hydrolase [Pseudonocardia sp. N23]|uniref:alpha/beta fold hydrolase n=1 Tax=Pseudonocardia sp. N23 TaxID=1987376 RepID=UPI000BFB7C4F|nr:alpha/beta fold hydrolase [Pseudonocardia sp. N23]GAY12967.1 transcriptional regulator, CadC [Pseudonocardia sp. N23]
MPTGPPPQQVRFCRSADGVKIAHARYGEGPPLVINSCWLSHLQYDWQSPVWRHFVEDLGRSTTTLRYDERGFGLSDWDVSDFSFEARIADLEAVVDDAGFDRFTLLGMAQGGPVAIAYAARHPGRVDRLILSSCSPATIVDDQDAEMEEAFVHMIRVGWARPESEFRRVFTSLMIPGATPEQMTWLDDLLKMSTSAANCIAARRGRYGVDVRPLLPGLDVPTLVIQSRGDRMTDFDDARELAAGIPGARLVALESENHILLADEPAWPVFLREVTGFVAPDAARPDVTQAVRTLTDRERDVLRLAAAGHDNDAIAAALTLSPRTVERHLQNAYAKLGVSGRSARAAAVAALLAAR